MIVLEGFLALAAVAFVVWAIFKGGELLDAILMAALTADDPEPTEHIVDDPK